MATFTSDGVTLAYDDIQPRGGAERTIVLVHGFTSNRHEGWKRTGWYTAFERRRVRAVALDQRGHGKSDKPHAAEAYGRGRMAGDVLALIDHLGLGRVDLFGFSMGAHVALAAAVAAPDRVSNLILGGVGGRMLRREETPGRTEAMVQSMLAEDPETIADPMLRSFRHFAEEQGEDRRALAACTGAPHAALDLDAMGALPMPVMVVAGQRDELAGDPDELAQVFPHGRGLTIVGCDHFSAIPHALTKAAVFDFLDGLLDDPFDGRF
jgi:pimeloyl-ACP methyl ester carboxylesterase